MYRTDGVGVVPCWQARGAKSPEQLTGAGTRYRGGMTEVARDSGVGGRSPGWLPGTIGHGSLWRGVQGQQPCRPSLERGAEERDKHLFSDGEGEDVCWSDGRETCGHEAHIGSHIMEYKTPLLLQPQRKKKPHQTFHRAFTSLVNTQFSPLHSLL